MKNFSKPKIYVINENTKLKDILNKIEGNKTYLFVLMQENGKSTILSDEFILKLSLNFDVNQSLRDLINKNSLKNHANSISNQTRRFFIFIFLLCSIIIHKKITKY